MTCQHLSTTNGFFFFFYQLEVKIFFFKFYLKNYFILEYSQLTVLMNNVCKRPEPSRAKKTLKNKNEFGELTLPDF